MRGEIVPAVMLPRFTTYVGEGSYTTPPMAVEAYSEGIFTFWRGPLVGGAALDPFKAYLEVSHDANVWAVMGSAITVPDTSSKVQTPFPRRWFRVRVDLLGDANGVVGITMWMAGVMERTVR
jgi:hypothetical protein